MQVKSKVYYDNLTGVVLEITPECEGGVPTFAKGQDMERLDQLKGRNANDIDFIELEFGTMSSILNMSKSCHIDVATKQLKVEYYTQAEIEELNNNNVPLSEAEQLEIDNANLLLELVQKDILISQLQGGV